MAEVVNGLHKHNLRLAKGRSKALDNKQYWEGYLAAVLANPQRPLFLYRRMMWLKIRWPYNARYVSRAGGAIETSSSASQADDEPCATSTSTRRNDN